jgi:hypothetical protein
MHEKVTQEKTGVQMALECARGVVVELETLALLAEDFDAVAGYVDALDQDIPAAREALSHLTDDELERLVDFYENSNANDAGDLLDHWLEGTLDTEVIGSYSFGGFRGWLVQEVAFLVTFGGPTIRVRWYGTETLTVEASWWSETVRLFVDCAPLADYAEEVAASLD